MNESAGWHCEGHLQTNIFYTSHPSDSNWLIHSVVRKLLINWCICLCM